MKNNLIFLSSKRETWTEIFKNSDLEITVSNHGRLNFLIKDHQVTLSMFDSVYLIESIKKFYYEK